MTGPAIKKNRDGSARQMFGGVIWREKPARKRLKRHDQPFSLETLRMREIEELIRHRHGNGIPDPAGTDDGDLCHAYLKAVACTPEGQDVVSWAMVWAPWADPVTLQMLLAQSSKRKLMIPADAVAKLLFVSMAERTTLGFKTIGACDIPKTDREKIAKDGKRERDRARRERQRRAEGKVVRHSYVAASTSQLKPWEAEGISRRTWYRRRGTSPSRIDINTSGDTPVPILPESVLAGQDRSRVAGLVAGLGDHPPAEIQEAAPHGSGDTKERAA